MPSIQQDVVAFKRMVRKACERIKLEYMVLPVYGQEAPGYRERVYCYELYHQLRRITSAVGFRYSLCGEIDKTGHPLIRGNYLDKAKPDLAVHIPGEMRHNLCVLEVKRINANVRSIAEDICKLSSFRRDAEYHSACFLIFGSRDQDSLETLRRRLISSAQLPTYRDDISMSLLTCLWHAEPGTDPLEIRVTEPISG
jgi:hypothetical protein